ncbi:MAG: DUF4446 family protein [Candidatus Pacebacteria bacterium]|nr:DUF4446 family protein [Candidatus Paceibacterota bacterium]
MNPKLDNIFFLAFFVLLGILAIAQAFWAFRTERRLKRFFLGKKAKDLEDTITLLQADIAKLTSARDQAEKDIELINKKLEKSIRGLEVIRFNPFPDQGGNQSFAIGLLNEVGDGVVLSSLYSRERMSIFAKPVKAGKSEFELSDEEKEVLTRAKVNE